MSVFWKSRRILSPEPLFFVHVCARCQADRAPIMLILSDLPAFTHHSPTLDARKAQLYLLLLWAEQPMIGDGTRPQDPYEIREISLTVSLTCNSTLHDLRQDLLRLRLS